MRRVLIDSGPLVALFDKNDRHHEAVITFLKTFRGELVTAWPVLGEASHMLDFNLNVQLDFLKWVHRGAITLPPIHREELKEIVEMMRTYTNVPMDLADATLVYRPIVKRLKRSSASTVISQSTEHSGKNSFAIS